MSAKFTLIPWLKRQPITIASSILILFLCWLEIVGDIAGTSLLQRLDHVVYDARLRATLEPDASALAEYQQGLAEHKVVILDIDEQSLKKQGRWPWSRATMGRLIRNLEQAGATVVGFDIVFSEPERNPAEVVLEQVPDIELKADLRKFVDQFDYDQMFADQLSRANIDVVAGYLFHQAVAITSGVLPEPEPMLAPHLIQNTIIPTMIGYEANIDPIQTAAYTAGFVSVLPDSDGSIRRAPLVFKYQDQLYPSLALSVAKTYRLADNIRLSTYGKGAIEKVEAVVLDDLFLPTDAKGQMLIPYKKNTRGYFPYVSASDVVDNTFDDELIQNAIVMVGSSAVGLSDLKPTPVSASFPGLESQAMVVHGILSGQVPSSPDWRLGVTLTQLVLTGGFLMLVFSYLGPISSGLVSLGLFLISIGLNVYFWTHHYLALSLASVLIEIILITVLYTVYGFYQETAQRVKIKSMFGQYVASKHIDDLLEAPDELSFEGETKEMTVLFADIRSFTSISEALSATALKKMLNQFFTPMTEIIFSHQGTIDKYVGDMIMAFWGAPLDDPKQCEHAVHASLKMLEKVELLKPEFKALGLPEVNIGIGLNTGLMNVGDMGSTFRRAYTVLGDAVNLGSRLESITKFYGAKLLVSETTRAGVTDVLFRLVDFIQVKGKEEPIKVYEPVCFEKDATAEIRGHIQQYEQARQAYLSQDWQSALTAFETLVQADPSREILYHLYIERIQMFMEHPPEAGWVGVFKHTSK